MDKGSIMDILEAIKARKSIRSYKADAVPREILEKILIAAGRSPSGDNAQQWEITVASGEILENIKRVNLEKLAARVPMAPDIPNIKFEGEYRRRQVEVAIQIFELMGIAREDKEKRAEWMTRGFCFFDAPAAFFIYTDNSVYNAYTTYNLGIITQTICLAALSYGLGTCIHNQGVSYPDVVRKFARIQDSKCIAPAISIGYPDWDFPANKLESKREPLEHFVEWRGFN